VLPFRNPQSEIRNPQSAIRNPKSFKKFKMEAKQLTQTRSIDFFLLALCVLLIGIGWLMIYTTGYRNGYPIEWWDFFLKTQIGKQIIATSICICIFGVLWEVKTSFWEQNAYFLYLLGVILLFWVLEANRHRSGSYYYFMFGGFTFQPTEIAKITTCLALSRFLVSKGTDARHFRNQSKIIGLILFPMWWILLQPNFGALWIFCSLWFVLFRAGFSPIPMLMVLGLSATSILSLLYSAETVFCIILLLTVGCLIQPVRKKQPKRIILILGMGLLSTIVMDKTQHFYYHQFKPHQQERINTWLHPEKCDPRGSVYHLNRSKIAIGSGGLLGKGFLQGQMTQLGHIPEVQSGFIFCTIGEEYGFMGVLTIISIFCMFLMRLVQIAERQISLFARYYAYGIAGFFFTPFLINVGMTMGLVPIWNASLPFISAGGSSMIGFTMMLAILLKMDSERQYPFL
jgi:rod shape determining protein RodA